MLLRSADDSALSVDVPMPPVLLPIAVWIWAVVAFCTPVGVWQFRQLLMNRFLSAVVMADRAAAAMVSERAWVSETDLESVTLAVKLYVPAVVGVPVMEPEDVNPIPGGRVPL